MVVETAFHKVCRIAPKQAANTPRLETELQGENFSRRDRPPRTGRDTESHTVDPAVDDGRSSVEI